MALKTFAFTYKEESGEEPWGLKGRESRALGSVWGDEFITGGLNFFVGRATKSIFACVMAVHAVLCTDTVVEKGTKLC